MKKKFFLTCISLFLICLVLCGCKKANNKDLKVSDYEIVAEYNDEEKTLNCIQKISYINNSDNILKELCFYLHANAFREGVKNKPLSFANEQKGYPNGKSYGKIDIENVSFKDNKVKYDLLGEDDNILRIPLDKNLYPEERVIVNIKYKVKLANINHRLGYGENTVNFGNFFPIACVYENGKFITNPYSPNGDPFYSQISNFKAKIIYPKEYIIASSGVSNTNVNENKKETNIIARKVRDFVFVLSKKFKVLEDKYNDTVIKYYYYKDKNPTKSLETSVKSIKTFSKLFGEYPYKQFSVVEANFVHGGMEYPNLVMISDDIEIEDVYQNVIVHETAHQWWYGIVGNDQFRYGYLDEGLTEYSTALFYEHNKGYNYTLEGLVKTNIQSYSVFVKVYSDVYGNVDTSMNRKLNEYATEPEYVYTSYVKGMLMFDSLKKILGEEKFLKCLKQYYKEYSFKEATPYNLIACFTKYGKRDLENFFNSWLSGKIIVFTD